MIEGKRVKGRTYLRKFDWDEARRRHASGESKSALAREYGVSVQAVRLAVDPEEYERSRQRTVEWHRQSSCPDCGKPTTRTRKGEDRRCEACAHLALASSVREHELRCFSCKKWLPDDSFPFARSKKHRARRYRHRQCRSCLTIARQDHRRRNREAENAYQREYKRRRRAEGR